MTQSNAIPNSIPYEFNDTSISQPKVEAPDSRIDWEPGGEAEFLRSHEMLLKPQVPVTGSGNIGSTRTTGTLFSSSPAKLQSPSDIVVEAAKDQWDRFRNLWS